MARKTTQAIEIRQRLEPLGTEERAVNEKRYLKSDLLFLGVKVPIVRQAAKRWLREQEAGEGGVLDRKTLLQLTDSLWHQGVHELRSFAIDLSIFKMDLLGPDDLHWLEQWLRDARTWAHVDQIAVHLVGRLWERDSNFGDTLERWSDDEDFWIRRSCLLVFLRGLREGEGDWQRVTRYCDQMLGEREFFIRKAIGWVLREASKKTPERVIEYVQARAPQMATLTFREATRKLPEDVQHHLKSLAV